MKPYTLSVLALESSTTMLVRFAEKCFDVSVLILRRRNAENVKEKLV